MIGLLARWILNRPMEPERVPCIRYGLHAVVKPFVIGSLVAIIGRTRWPVPVIRCDAFEGAGIETIN